MIRRELQDSLSRCWINSPRATNTQIRRLKVNADGKTSINYARLASSRALPKEPDEQHRVSLDNSDGNTTPIGRTARQKQANKEFFVNLLNSAATKRDAKAYISRLKSPSKVEPAPRTVSRPRPQVNLGSLFATARAVEESPVFSQYESEQKGFEEQETLHIALVKVYDLDRIPDNVLVGIAETLCQLARLSMSPCVVLEASTTEGNGPRSQLKSQADRLATAINAMSEHGSRIVEGIFTIPKSSTARLSLGKLLMTPLRRGLIPIVIPTAYSEADQKVSLITANEAVIALTERFADLYDPKGQAREHTPTKQVSLDRIIIIDHAGGIPNPVIDGGMHVFLNLEQEYSPVSQHLEKSGDRDSMRHLSNLKMLRQVLQLLPHSASGLIVAPEEAANMSTLDYSDNGPSSVGTRRRKNALIHNLLTDKPAFSSSLPEGRLSKDITTSTSHPVTTFVKHGMPLTILPDPHAQPWTPNSPRIKLTSPQIDLQRLVYLIDDSFNRSLDVENYLKRVNDRIAGIIIAGDYEGGAILTWETPPGCDTDDTDRLVPYLDKFAVLKKSQGAGGVADIVFNAMVRTCFPDGVCWRSRKNNPVNKWYFERSRGTRKIPDMNWTMFWTTPGVPEDRKRFQDYEGVCRGVEPTWLDKKIAAD